MRTPQEILNELQTYLEKQNNKDALDFLKGIYNEEKEKEEILNRDYWEQLMMEEEEALIREEEAERRASTIYGAGEYYMSYDRDDVNPYDI